MILILKGIKKWYRDSLLFKIAYFNSISVIVRLISGFLISKGTAFFLLPQGMALTGNLRSFLISCQGVSLSGSQSGIIKYTAENKNDLESLRKIVSTSFFFILSFTLITSFILFFFSDYFSQLVFNSSLYDFAFRILALVIPLYTFNVFILSILNGLGKYKKIIKVNTIGYVFNVVIILLLMYFYKLEGAILAIILVPSILLIITLTLVKDIGFIVQNISTKRVSFKYLKGLMTFMIMALVTALTIPVMHLIIKNHIIDNIGLTQAGYWEAMLKISQYYLMFFMSLFSLYLLPKLSENKTDSGFKKLVVEFYKILLPILIIAFITVYICRYWVVRIALTEEFLPVKNLFFWQLIGDFFKIIAFTLAYQLQAKKMLFWYIFGELFYVVLVYFFSVYFINKFDVKGAVIAHAFSYFSYFILMLFIFRNTLFKKETIKV